MTRHRTPARVAIIGAGGYGRHHRRRVAKLQAAGTVDLVGLSDPAPIRDEPDAPIPTGAELTTDHGDLLAKTQPDVAIVATPPHTHATIATDAVRAGADVLVEKPPFVDSREHEAFISALDDTGRACQTGFQALGSAALAELAVAIRTGELGPITGIGAYGSWQRPDSYYDRSPWAGRRELDGVPILDGALANPFAHAVMQSLEVASIAGATEVTAVATDLYRARPIEVDDTGAVRVLLSGPDGADVIMVVAVTLCGDIPTDPAIIVHGSRGRAVLEYTTDRLRMPGDGSARHVPGRMGLLENLLDHRDDPAVPLLADVRRTAGFTTVIDHIRSAGTPARIGAEYQAVTDASDAIVTIPGSHDLVLRAAEHLALPSELGTEWAVSAARERQEIDAG